MALRFSSIAAEGEEDIEVILSRIAAKESLKTNVTIVDTDSPPVRANASAVRVGDELILFGGEYFDGAVNHCFNEVFRYNLVRLDSCMQSRIWL